MDPKRCIPLYQVYAFIHGMVSYRLLEKNTWLIHTNSSNLWVNITHPYPRSYRPNDIRRVNQQHRSLRICCVHRLRIRLTTTQINQTQPNSTHPIYYTQAEIGLHIHNTCLIPGTWLPHMPTSYRNSYHPEYIRYLVDIPKCNIRWDEVLGCFRIIWLG